MRRGTHCILEDSTEEKSEVKDKTSTTEHNKSEASMSTCMPNNTKSNDGFVKNDDATENGVPGNNGTENRDTGYDEMTANKPTKAQSVLAYAKKLSADWNWKDFFYAFIFGFLPTAWDGCTDIALGKSLQNQNDLHSAGLCWMFVCLPPVYLVIEHFTSTWLQVFRLGLGIIITVTIAWLINFYPWAFYYPAVCFCLLLLGEKTLALFIHTPEMKQFSRHLSQVECSFEASCQLLLILSIRLTGGQLPLASLISSIVVIGKVSAENYLMAGPENLLADKPLHERIALTLRYMPVFALTAFFRCGAGVVNVLNYNSFIPFSPAFVIFLAYCYNLAYYFLFMFLGFMLRAIMPDLKEMSVVELSNALVGWCRVGQVTSLYCRWVSARPS
jgi:hypothetical protein